MHTSIRLQFDGSVNKCFSCWVELVRDKEKEEKDERRRKVKDERKEGRRSERKKEEERGR